MKITVIATGIDGNSRTPLATINQPEEDKDQISLDLDDEITNNLDNDELENTENSNIDNLHPLGDDEHFEIPAFIRKPKK